MIKPVRSQLLKTDVYCGNIQGDNLKTYTGCMRNQKK